MLATLDKDDWEAISAIGTWFGVVITFLAVLVALFGEQARNCLMRPRLTVSCGLPGLLFQEDKKDYSGQDCFHLRLLASNSGRQSAQNVQCVLASIRTWDGTKWCLNDRFLPERLNWQIERGHNLPIMAPDSSSLLELGLFFGTNPGWRETHLWITRVYGEELAHGRHELEVILTSDHRLHHHTFFELSWTIPSEGKASRTFAIKESRRITSD